MNKKDDKTKSTLIQKILLCCKANNVYISGDLFFSLAFRTVEELKKIAHELHINIAK